jgi:hypothetical protein
VRIKKLFRFALQRATPILNLPFVAEFPSAAKLLTEIKPHAYLAIVSKRSFLFLH